MSRFLFFLIVIAIHGLSILVCYKIPCLPKIKAFPEATPSVLWANISTQEKHGDTPSPNNLSHAQSILEKVLANSKHTKINNLV